MELRIKRTGVQAYYETVSQLFRLQSQVLTGVLPHYGERGGTNEERVRAFIRQTLPRRYSVGSGFIVCSDETLQPSSQTDIVVHDDYFNAPLHTELSANVYPIESVYGIVEVKGTLRRADIAKIGADINKVRRLALNRRYVQFASVPVDPADSSKRVAQKNALLSAGPPPRSFVFAFSQSGWRSAEALAKSLTTAHRKAPTHIHGLIVVNDGWYIAQQAHAPDGPAYYVSSENALLQFLNGMLDSLGSLDMAQGSLEEYFGKSLRKGRWVRHKGQHRPRGG